MISKKDKERSYLKLFLQLLDFHPKEIKDDEKPDFSVLLNNIRIGIEITEYVESKEASNTFRSIQETFKSIEELVAVEIKRIHPDPINLNYRLRHPILGKINRNKKNEIIQFLLSHITNKEIQNKLKNDSVHEVFQYTSSQNKFFEAISVNKVKHWTNTTVTQSGAYVSGPIPKGNIENIITSKERKIIFDKNSINWLIIVISETAISNGADIQETANLTYKKGKFEKIFLLRTRKKLVYQLNIGDD